MSGPLTSTDMNANDITVEDRIVMDDLLTRYATAIDSLDWEMLDSVFIGDAHLDYRSAGGIEGSYPEVRQWLTEVLPLFEVTQHLVVNREFGRHDGGVYARSCFLNVNRLQVDGKPWQFTVGGRYHDQLVRSHRVAHRQTDRAHAVVGSPHARTSGPPESSRRPT